ACVKNVANMICLGIHAVNHAHQQRLPSRNRDRARVSASRRSQIANRRGDRRLCIGLRRPSCRLRLARTPRKRQCHNVVCRKRLHFPVNFETESSLRSTHIFALQNSPIFQFQCIGSGCSRQSCPQHHCAQKFHQRLHTDSPRLSFPQSTIHQHLRL